MRGAWPPLFAAAWGVITGLYIFHSPDVKERLQKSATTQQYSEEVKNR
jgi:hypothetical protein